VNPSALPEPFDLATADQLSTERLALRVYGTPRVEEAIRQVDALFRSDPTALTRDGAATLEQVVRDVTFCAVTYAVSADPARPRILWTQTPPHSWHGFSVPGARYNLENPDNIYRLIQIDGSHRYRIAGCRSGAGPAQFLFELIDSAPGITSIGNQIDCLRSEQLQVEPDGRFTITIGPEPRTTGNHLRSTPATRAIFIRDVLSDWERQTANSLRIEMIEGPMAPAPSDSDLEERAALLVPSFAAFWLRFRTYMFETIWHGAINKLPDLDPRIGAWGYVTGARYTLAKDDALIVRIGGLDARYIGFQLADPWGMVGTDYIHKTGSLNNTQAQPNEDGTWTYVISLRDPGVANWLDADGLEEGTLLIRWQQITAAGSPAGAPAAAPSAKRAIRDVRVAKVDDARGLLPALVVDDRYRAAQRIARCRSFERRFHASASIVQDSPYTPPHQAH
jgi:hypothetical protein